MTTPIKLEVVFRSEVLMYGLFDFQQTPAQTRRFRTPGQRWFWLFLCILLNPVLMRAASLPVGFSETQFGGAGANMSSPTALAFAPDGRLFVCQQNGSLRVIKNGTLLGTPFLTVSVNASGERGLLGVAFDPNFASNQFVYVYYTTSAAPVHNRVSRFTANGDVALAGSEVILLELDNLSGATNHNGGALHFGPDGKLYIAVGENASPANAQSLSNLLGKLLRINADGTIPADNPFLAQTTGRNRAIWVLGLRNPFTFNFQPGTGRMFINDVGQNTTEEINDGAAGLNFGWPNCEGNCNPPNANFANPIFSYQNDASTCAITGGTFYNPAVQLFPAEYAGKYFFADYCAGWIRVLNPATNTASGFATGLSSCVDLQVGPDGALYYLQRGGGGQVWRVAFGSNAPQITQHPASISVNVGESATFTVTATSALPLSYQWQRNAMDIENAVAASYTLNNVSLGDNGALFRCVVSNGQSAATSNAATLSVINNLAPTATITQPSVGTLYSGGQLINFAGTGSDPEDGTLPASAFTWEVVFHHDTHTHPFIAPFSGVTSGTFTIPTQGETAANVWYRIHLKVTDAGGRIHTVFRDINPRTVTLTLQTTPAGLQLTLDGQPLVTPQTISSVVGIERQLGVVSPQSLNGALYRFANWSDNGAAVHTIATPPSNTVYTAAFEVAAPAVKSDFDGDGKSDLAVWRGPAGHWLSVNSSNQQTQTVPWGTSAAPYFDVPVPGDYDGDGKTDQAIWRGGDSIWYIRKSSDGLPLLQLWGSSQAPYFDLPAPGDFDGDGKTDLAVWRPSTGTWFILKSSDGAYLSETWGMQGDVPVAADYDGDGKTDVAVWRGSTGQWLLKFSAGGSQTLAWGAGYAPYFDVPVPADYDGDGKADPAIWRGQDSTWYIRQSSNGQPRLQLWGASYAPYFDVPAPADYDGDGQADLAVWRSATGTWYVRLSSNGSFLAQPHGQPGDTPLTATGIR
jgi:glucose/arabinose dehydrogenase